MILKNPKKMRSAQVLHGPMKGDLPPLSLTPVLDLSKRLTDSIGENGINDGEMKVKV
jgi:hypothetical protein